MGIEYKIRFELPDGYSSEGLLRRLPSADIANGSMPAYDFALKSDGFYFLDHLSDDTIAAKAFRVLVEEGLRHAESVQISEL